MGHIKTTTERLTDISKWIFIGLLAYMPLHIFVSTWLGTSFNVLELTRILKDVVLLIGFGLALVAAWRQPWFKKLCRDKLVWLILGYAALTLLLAVLRPTDQDAEILGVVYNTRFLVFFLYGVLLIKLNPAHLVKQSIMAVLGGALIVLSFGILQYTVLPNTALEHVGYVRANGVLPAFFIDEKPDLERIMSTLRDPNSFGSYIIIIISLALALLLRRPKYKQLSLGFLLLGTLCLWFTFSRSAWIGAVVAILTVTIVSFRKKAISKKWLNMGLAIIAITGVLGMSTLYVARNTYFVQNVIFHADESTVLEDPNELRVRFWQESVSDIVSDPLGSGPGTAGLASIRNNVQGTELNENYYLQIGSEVGIIGLGLFLAILVVVAKRLFDATGQSWLALGLFGAFTGLLVTNFLVHIWSNEAVAYTWWGLAGLVIAIPRTNQKGIHR